MRAISLHEPWASLVVYGHKKIETRSWSTAHRGRLVIHATANRGCMDELEWWHKARGLDAAIFDLPYTFGALLGSVDVMDCIPTDTVTQGGNLSMQEDLFGDYAPGRYAWLLSRPLAYPAPIPYKGSRLLWDVPDPMLSRLKG